MSRLGPGSSCRHPRPQFVAQAAAALPLLVPAAEWTGVAGSGFAGVPGDPVRTTAKPALRLLVPPNQRFTDTLTVGVMAFANANGTLIGGIDRVRFHFEGRSLDIVAPRLHTITDANGVQRRYWGYWINLVRPTGKQGDARLYVEAIPADATMQRRVIGPFTFFPRATLYDSVLTVDPDAPAVAGRNYHTVGAAIGYHRSNANEATLVTVLKPLTEDLGATVPSGTAYVGKGYCTVTATAPVVFAKSSFAGDAAAQFRPRINRLHFRGESITFDMRFVSSLWKEDSVDGEHWLDGCRFINSAGRYSLWRAGFRPYGHLVRGSPFFTEAAFVDVADACNLAQLARGCTMVRGYNDFSGDGRCVVYNRIEGLDSTDGWLQDVPALTVTYTGPAATATLAISGPADTNSRTITAVWGSNTASFIVGKTEALYNMALASGYNPVTAGQGYFVQNVADWLNSLPGWSATVLDNSRRASALALPGGKGAPFAAQSVKNSMLTLVTCFDLHGDFYQQRFGGLTENCIIALNWGRDMRGQNVFLSGDVVCNDFMVVGNAFSNVPADNGYAIWTQVSSQCDRTPHSHVVFVHNTMPTQRLMLRADNASYNPDAYCLIANNAMLNVAWVGTPTATHLDIVIKDNVIDTGFSAPTGATGTVIGGDYTSKFANSLTGDFTPTGILASNLKTPAWSFGAPGLAAQALAPAGALTV